MQQPKKERVQRDWYSIVFNGIIVFAIIAAIAVFVAIMYLGMSDLKEATDKGDEITTSTVELVSIQYQSEQVGSFYLGFGNVSDTDYYICYKIREDGGKELIKFDAATTVIYDVLSADEMAYAEVSVNGYDYIKEVKLYVPKDTIQVSYDFETNK